MPNKLKPLKTFAVFTDRDIEEVDDEEEELDDKETEVDDEESGGGWRGQWR